MSEYAPAAIQRLFDQIQAAMPTAILSGIIGDQAHTYGYHRGRNYVSPGDYSAELPEDLEGDGDAACGLDISWTDGGPSQRLVSQRLMDAAHDSRMAAAREFYGTTDGQTVCGWDYYHGAPASSDPSHLWHIHLSILRKYANDQWMLDRIAAVIIGDAGGGSAPIEEDDSMSAADVEKVIDSNNDQTTLIVYGDGRDVPPDRNTHPDNLKYIRADVGTVIDQGELILYGDGRDATDEGRNTHPFNLYEMNRKLDRILALLEE